VSKVIVVNNNRVLMLQKAGTLKWELPGGHANPGEKMKKAAIRELREELGTRLKIDDLRRVQQTILNKYKTHIYVYTAPIKQKPRLSDEHVAYKWLKANELDNYTLSPSTNHLAILSALTNG
jgi:8-oxo-dGTP diphosphatase